MKDDTPQTNLNAEAKPAKKLSFMERHKEKMRQFELRQQAEKEAFKERQKQGSKKINEMAEKFDEKAVKFDEMAEKFDEMAEKFDEKAAKFDEKAAKFDERYERRKAEIDDFANNPDREEEREALNNKIMGYVLKATIGSGLFLFVLYCISFFRD